ncbi:MAG: LemA family protein [Bacteroidales bacterium]|nr:LemA family protein [Bacteroidales bacterium]MBN2698927.1 LemA family protein [Bacteroidales bacterium]
MIVTISIILFTLLVGIAFYNSLIKKKNDVENAFASIDVMLKKRYDLIPAIVEAVKGYMKHERALLEEITALRAEAISDNITDDQRVDLENKIGKGLSELLVAVENYPDLKASHNFLHLQGSLNEVEEQLAASRRFYNAAVTLFNNSVEVFPSNIIASLMNFRRKSLFEIPKAERTNIDAKELMERR